MSRDFLAVFVVALLTIAQGFGQNYRGTYTMTSGDVTLTLTLDQDAAGRITGSLTSTKGTRFRLEGVITEGVAQGTCAGDAAQSYFEAEFEESKLIFTLVEVSADGEGSSRSLEFTRSKDAGAKGVPVPPAPAGERKPSLPAPAPEPASPAMPAQTDSDLMRYFAGDTIPTPAVRPCMAEPARNALSRSVLTASIAIPTSSAPPAPAPGARSTIREGTARWSIQGDRNRGVISVTYGSGQTKRIPYQVVSKDEGAILFDGIKFAFAGAPKCR